MESSSRLLIRSHPSFQFDTNDRSCYYSFRFSRNNGDKRNARNLCSHARRERQKVGRQAALRSCSCVCGCGLNFGYQRRNRSSRSSLRTLVLVCSKRRAPRSVHCICCFLTNRLLTTWGQLRKRKFTYAKGRCLLVRETAQSCNEERWTSSTKQRVPNTSFPAKRAVIEFWSVLF